MKKISILILGTLLTTGFGGKPSEASQYYPSYPGSGYGGSSYGYGASSYGPGGGDDYDDPRYGPQPPRRSREDSFGYGPSNAGYPPPRDDYKDGYNHGYTDALSSSECSCSKGSPYNEPQKLDQ